MPRGATGSTPRSGRGDCGLETCRGIQVFGGVAQSGEHGPVKTEAAGSKPATTAKLRGVRRAVEAGGPSSRRSRVRIPHALPDFTRGWCNGSHAGPWTRKCRFESCSPNHGAIVQSARTPAPQAGNAGSNPAGATKFPPWNLRQSSTKTGGEHVKRQFGPCEGGESGKRA